MLTLAWSSGAAPVVVLTKNDLATRDLVPDVAAVALGVDVVATSSLTGENLDAVRRLLGPGRTFVLVGPSGAGKSSLVNALAGREVLATGDVRGDGRGRRDDAPSSSSSRTSAASSTRPASARSR